MSSPWPLALLLCAALVGCADQIGDDCETALDCSQSGRRACDRTQPGGYCTIRGCEKGTCPEEAVCVKFRPQEERLAVTFCMLKCEDDGDCRSDEGYRCYAGETQQESSKSSSRREFGNGMEAQVLDGEGKQFCSAEPRAPISVEDAGGDEPAPPAAHPDVDASAADAAPIMSSADGG